MQDPQRPLSSAATPSRGSTPLSVDLVLKLLSSQTNITTTTTTNTNGAHTAVPGDAHTGGSSGGGGWPLAASGYSALTVVGKGAFGMVLKARQDSNGDTLAVKLIDVLSERLQEQLIIQMWKGTNNTDVMMYNGGRARLPKPDVPLLERELRNQAALKHPHVVRLRAVIFIEQYMALVMPFYSGGTLHAYIVAHEQHTGGGLLEDIARRCMQQIVLGVVYCHSRGVALRDIKPENILLEEECKPMTGPPVLRLCDFGLSKNNLCDSRPDSTIGTPGYMAPEVVRLQTGETYDAQKADVWSLGMVLAAMLLGRMPPWAPRGVGDDRAKIIEAHRVRVEMMALTQPGVDEWVESQGAGLAPGVRQLLKKLLHVDPGERMTANDIIQDPWWRQGLPEASHHMLPPFNQLPPPQPYTGMDLAQWLSVAYPAPADLKFMPSQAAAPGWPRLQEALQQAKVSNKMLMVSIYCPIRLDSHRLNHITLKDWEVSQLISECFVFWQVEAGSPDAEAAFAMLGEAPLTFLTQQGQQLVTQHFNIVLLLQPGVGGAPPGAAVACPPSQQKPYLYGYKQPHQFKEWLEAFLLY